MLKVLGVLGIIAIIGFALQLLTLRYPNLFAFNPYEGVIRTPASFRSGRRVTLDLGSISVEPLTQRFDILVFGDEPVVGVSQEGGRFLFIPWGRAALELLLRDRDGKIVAEVRRGKFVVNPYTSWTLTRNGRHFEVKDLYGDFVSVNMDAIDRIRIRGQFSYRGTRVQISDQETVLGNLRVKGAGAGRTTLHTGPDVPYLWRLQ